MITIGVLIFAAMIVPVVTFAIVEFITKSRAAAFAVAGMVFLLIVATLLAVASINSTAGAPELP